MWGLLIVCLVACLVGKGQSQCDALEGSGASWFSSPGSRYPNGSANFTELAWKLTSGNTTTVISQCFSDGSCVNNYKSKFAATVTSTNSHLIFTNVARTLPFNVEAKVHCDWSTTFSYNVCSKFNVIAKPRSVSCVLVPVNATVTYMNCTIERSYPSSVCILQISRDNVTFTSYGSVVNYSMAATNETPVYFSGTCQMLLNDRLYLGTNYLRAVTYPSSLHNAKYYVYGEALVFKSGSSVPEAPSTSESGAVIGLAVATGVFGFVAVALSILIILFWLRNKKKTKMTKTNNTKMKTKPPISPKPASVPMPEGYHRVDSPELNPDDNYYEEVNKPKATSVGPGMYANSSREINPDTTSVAANTKRLVQQMGMYTNSRTDKNRVKVSARGTKKQPQNDSRIDETYVNAGEYMNSTT